LSRDQLAGNREGNRRPAQNGAVQATSISLPKGGGAIRGMGEKFAANPVTGTGSITVPIATSPGRSGFGPQLALFYDSAAGNGPFGFGWTLSLPAIARKTDKGLPRYLDAEDSDVFILSGAEELVPVFEQDGAGDWVRDAEGKSSRNTKSMATSSAAIGHGSRASLRGSSAGPTRSRATCTGVRSRATTSRPSMVRKLDAELIEVGVVLGGKEVQQRKTAAYAAPPTDHAYGRESLALCW